MSNVSRVEASKACVVVPMYNEATAIGDTCRQLRSQFERIICVDDGSSDGSAQVALHAGAEVLRHPINLGQGAALQTGISHALRVYDPDFVVTFDADGQHDARDANRLLRLAESRGVDFVLGSRFLTPGSSVPSGRRLFLAAGTAFTRITTGLPLTDTHNGLRVLSRTAAGGLNLRHNGMAHASEILSYVADSGLSWTEAPVSIAYTAYSTSKGQTNLNALNILVDMIVGRIYSRT